MKILILKQSENVSTVVTQDIFLIPSHFGVKKDIYAYNLVGDFIGIVSIKNKNGFLDRDKLMLKYGHDIPLSKSFSLKCKLLENKDKTIIVEDVHVVDIPNVSVFKTQPTDVSLLELAHMQTTTNLINKNIIKKDGDDKMMKTTNKLGVNFSNIFGGEIGMVKSDKVKLGLNGEIAIKRADGDYVTFKEDGTILNVSQFAFDMGGLFIVPVTVDNVKKGDIIIKDGTYYHVDEDGELGQGLHATSVDNSEIKEFRLTKSMLLNNEYVRKVISPFSMFGGFGGDNGFMALAMMSSMNLADEKSEMLNTLMMAQMINGGQNGFDTKKMIPFIMMNQSNNMSDLLALSLMTGNDLFGTNKKEECKQATLKEEVKKCVEEILNK